MRVRVPVAVRNRLLRLESKRPVDLPIGGWSPIMDLDDWEVLASRMQDELAELAQEDVPEKPALERSPQVRKADDGPGEQSGRSAVLDYLQAQQRQREAAAAHRLQLQVRQ